MTASSAWTAPARASGGAPGARAFCASLDRGRQRGGALRLLAAIPGPAAEADEPQGNQDRPGEETPHARSGNRRAGRGASRARRRSASAGADGRRPGLAAACDPDLPFTEAPSAAEKLPVLSVPVSTPEGRISTRVVAERLSRTTPPIWMAAALMLASTWAPSATKTLPETLISPSNLPRIWKSPRR